MAKNTKATKKSKKDPVKTSLVGKYKALYRRDKVLWALLTGGCLLLVGGSIFGGIVLYEKWQFNKAEKALDSLYADIVANVGQPAKVEKTKSCGYSSAKYSKGDLSCSISYELQFIGIPSNVINDIESITRSSVGFTDVSEIIQDDTGFQQKYFSFSPKNSDIRCAAENSTRKPDVYYISCSRGTIIKHYLERM